MVRILSDQIEQASHPRPSNYYDVKAVCINRAPVGNVNGNFTTTRLHSVT